MELEIVNKTDNPLLSREEIEFKVYHSGEPTPSREVIVAKLAAILNAETERTILKEIQSHYGVRYSMGKANLYKDSEVARKIEPKYILKRNGLLEEE